MDPRRWKNAAAYIGLLGASYVIAIAASWRFGAALDNAAYDYMFRQVQPKLRKPETVLLAIDEATLRWIPGGIRGIRKPLADALNLIATAGPSAVAVDITLADTDPSADADLARALCSLSKKLVLNSELVEGGGQWEDPIAQFKACAARTGHVHSLPDDADSRTRAIPLLKRAGRSQRYALALEAFSLARGYPIEEASWDLSLRVGPTIIPVPDARFGRLRGEDLENRPMRVRFMDDAELIPRISLKRLLEDRALVAQFGGKTVFIGVTASSASDRWLTPASRNVPTTGVVIHAEAYETIAQRLFITDVAPLSVLLICVPLVAAAGAAFHFLAGWRAYVAGAGVLVAAQVIPYIYFTQGRVLPFSATMFAAWLGAISAAAYYHLVVRRKWLTEQSARIRYQYSFQFATHEMRTPLSAIQGSSELMSRFPLTEEKRKQIVQLINAESKRLARLVEVFLNVERLSAGQMELKREPIAVNKMVDACIERTQPLAERKHIEIHLQPIPDNLLVTGDRELMEYACYNLLTNAVKYSPQRTAVTVSGWKDGAQIRVAVKDQGMGMDQKEVRQIFQKFYRTRKAEQSGEAGTGIGLSIVHQIVEQHGGDIEVASQPGVGSCFTLVLPAAHAAEPARAERS
jgi:signal transduction histidine kinase